MTSIMIQAFKYIMMFLFLGYVWGAFSVFRYGKQPEKQKRIYAFQKVSLFAMHGMGFFSLYLQEPSTKIIVFYAMQVAVFGVIFLFYHYMYKKCSILLLNNMVMLLAIGMIALTRISFEKAFRQFIFLAIGSIAMLVIPLFLQPYLVFQSNIWLLLEQMLIYLRLENLKSIFPLHWF